MSTHADIVAAATPQTATTSPVVVAAAAAQTAMISAAVALASPDLAEASGTGTVRGPSRHRGSGGDPRGSEAQTGDPTVPRPTFRGGSAATDFPFYNIKREKRPEHGSPQGHGDVTRASDPAACV